MIPGETVGAKTTECVECHQTLTIKVCHSWGGYYVGFICPNCGPYSRESYFDTDQFRDIYYDLPNSSAKSEWVNRILEKGGEHQTLLLDWAKRKNPNRYHLFFK